MNSSVIYGHTAIDMFVDKVHNTEGLRGVYKNFNRFLLLHLKEQHAKHRLNCILSTIALGLTGVGLPFIFKFITQYRKGYKAHKETKTVLESLLYTYV